MTSRSIIDIENNEIQDLNSTNVNNKDDDTLIGAIQSKSFELCKFIIVNIYEFATLIANKIWIRAYFGTAENAYVVAAETRERIKKKFDEISETVNDKKKELKQLQDVYENNGIQFNGFAWGTESVERAAITKKTEELKKLNDTRKIYKRSLQACTRIDTPLLKNSNLDDVDELQEKVIHVGNIFLATNTLSQIKALQNKREKRKKTRKEQTEKLKEYETQLKQLTTEPIAKPNVSNGLDGSDSHVDRLVNEEIKQSKKSSSRGEDDEDGYDNGDGEEEEDKEDEDEEDKEDDTQKQPKFFELCKQRLESKKQEEKTKETERLIESQRMQKEFEEKQQQDAYLEQERTFILDLEKKIEQNPSIVDQLTTEQKDLIRIQKQALGLTTYLTTTTTQPIKQNQIPLTKKESSNHKETKLKKPLQDIDYV